MLDFISCTSPQENTKDLQPQASIPTVGIQSTMIYDVFTS